MNENYHLHAYGFGLEEIVRKLPNKKILVPDNIQVPKKFLRKIKIISLEEFIRPKDFKQISNTLHDQCLEITKDIIQKFNHLDSYISECKYRNLRIDSKKLNKRLSKSLYPSVYWIWNATSSKEYLIKKLNQKYNITSFTTYIDQFDIYRNSVDDKHFHSELRLSDYWHAMLFSDVANYVLKDKKKYEIFLSEKHYLKRNNKTAIIFDSINYKFKYLFNKLITTLYRFVFYKSNTLFVAAGCSNKYEKSFRKKFKLQMLKLPTKFCENNYSKNDLRKHNLNKYKFSFADKNSVIKNYLPYSCKEGFSHYIKKSRLYSSLIYSNYISGGLLTFQTLIRFHVLLFRPNKSKLFILSHGIGGICSPTLQQHEMIMGDYYFPWGNSSWCENFNKTIAIKPTDPCEELSPKLDKKFKNKIYLILCANPKEILRICSEMNYENHAKKKIPELLENLIKSNKVLKNFYIRPYPSQINYSCDVNELENIGGSLDNNLKKRFPNVFHDALSSGFEIENSSAILIYTYFISKSFSKRLSSNKPFIIFNVFEPNWFDEKFYSLIDQLKTSYIYFDDPIKLSLHLDNIQSNYESWWFSTKVRESLKVLSQNYGTNLTFSEKFRELKIN